MSDNSHIEWTDASWNPIRARIADAMEWEELPTGWHCERVSPGCQHCYAETINEKRFGTGLPYNRKSRDLVRIELDEKALTQPLHWRRPRKVFVCSMTDLFAEWVPDDYIDRVFAVMALSPQHTFQVLTKRPERMREYVGGNRTQMDIDRHASQFNGGDFRWPGWPLPNVWLGTSVEDQQRANERIGHLLATPAAVRFISAEPLLGPLVLSPSNKSAIDRIHEIFSAGPAEMFGPPRPKLDWAIVGGESGPGARPCDIEWIRGIVGQCQAAGVAVFVKQIGAKPVSCYSDEGDHGWPYKLRDRKGGNPDEWPEDLRVREWPQC